MKWDIDRALTALEDTGAAGTSISRVDIMGADEMERLLGNVTDTERAKEGILVWCIALGALRGPKLFIYGRTIRAAYLRARKVIRRLSPEDLMVYRLRVPTKKPRKKAK